MKVSIFGMGYVGCVTAAGLIKQGHSVVGVDVVQEKIDILAEGRWPVYEWGLENLVPREVVLDKLKAITDTTEGILETDVSIICVGTPGLPDGRVDLTYICKTVEDINRALVEKNKEHIVLIRSTVPPGTTESLLIPILQRDLQMGKVLVGYYPEFLREGSAIEDFFKPSLHVLGCGKTFRPEIMKGLLPQVTKEVNLTSIRTAEAIKYANNAFHALKIVFANEFALICNEYRVDSNDVMEIFCQDKILNLSSYYLKPGFAFGGSCLPKEVRAVISMSREKRIEPILFEAILRSNDQMIQRLVSLIYRMEPSSIGYFGITFKPRTDDIRESPVLRTIEMLLSKTTGYSKGIKQIVFDDEGAVSKIRGKLGDGLEIARTPKELIQLSDVLVLGPYKIDQSIESEIVSSGKPVVDLKWHEVGARLAEYPKYHTIH